MDKEHGKREGFFSGLLKKRAFNKVEPSTSQTEEEAIQHSQLSNTASPGDDTEVVEKVDYGRLIFQTDGGLLRLWKKCYGDRPYHGARLGDSSLLPQGLDLQREAKRIMTHIDQDARSRIDVLQAVERLVRERQDKEAKERAERFAKGIPEPENVEEDPGPSLDACCYVYCSLNNLVAWMMIFPPYGPEGSLKMEMLAKALEDAKVTTGIDSSAVSKLFMNKSYFELIPVAFGTPPEQGEDGKIVERFLRELPKEVKLDERGVADYRAQSLVQSIDQGTVICDIIPPREGVAGVRVDGNPAEPYPVKAAKIPCGTNTSVSEDGTQLIASREGHLEYVGGCFQIKPVLEIPGDVDYSTGNIDFRGDVHIKGDVRENFVVKATGTITIDGLVEAAHVEGGNGVLVTCGVLGDNRAFIKSGSYIKAKYLENCVAYAADCIYADCIMASQIFSDNAVDVTSGRGTIIGGTIVSAQSIKSRVIGTESGRETNIILGTLPYVQNELDGIETDLQASYQELEQLERDLVYLADKAGMAGSNEKLGKARLRKSVVSMKIQSLIKKRERLEPMVPDLTRCRLESSTVYPITKLTIQGVIWQAKSVRHSCKLAFDPKTAEIHEY